MATAKSMKIQAEIDKVKAKISEQQARLKELEQKKLEAENSEIVDIVRGMSIPLAELPLVLQKLRDDGTLGQSVPKSEPAPVTEGKDARADDVVDDDDLPLEGRADDDAAFAVVLGFLSVEGPGYVAAEAREVDGDGRGERNALVGGPEDQAL